VETGRFLTVLKIAKLFIDELHSFAEPLRRKLHAEKRDH
jgi:hypothetical protein